MDSKENIYRKRNINNVIIFNSVIFIGLMCVMFLYIKPGFTDVAVIKTTLADTAKQYKDMTKKGLTFAEFKNLSEIQNDKDLKDITSQLDEKFYNENYTNQKDKNYEEFIEKKIKEIKDLKKNKVIEQRDTYISKMVPLYNKDYFVEGSISDLEFVNYVELLLKTFGIKTDTKIGISQVTPLDEKSLDKKQDNFKSQIFYIPLNMSIEGQKKDIIDFIYYISNINQIIGSPTSEKDFNSSFYKDDYFKDKVKLLGDKNNSYITKMIDIKSISIPEYFDKSTNIRVVDNNSKTNMGYVNYLNSDELSKYDKIKLDIDLRFYIRGIPTYKIESFIEQVIKNYKTLSANIDGEYKKLQNDKNKQANAIKIAKLESLIRYIKDYEPKIKQIETSLKKKDVSLTGLYKDIVEIKYDIDNISTTYKQ